MAYMSGMMAAPMLASGMMESNMVQAPLLLSVLTWMTETRDKITNMASGKRVKEQCGLKIQSK